MIELNKIYNEDCLKTMARMPDCSVNLIVTSPPYNKNFYTKKAKIKNVGLRPGEKLHEDMLAETELPFTYKVDNVNLLQVRPQYSQRVYQSFQKYNGPHFNSELWVQKDVDSIVELIQRGLSC